MVKEEKIFARFTKYKAASLWDKQGYFIYYLLISPTKENVWIVLVIFSLLISLLFCSDYKTGEEGKKEGKNQNNGHFNLRTSRLRSWSLEFY